jgi:23S rRNA (uridine2552-2'-O)-methyltransferase
MKKSSSSKKWLQRHAKDEYVIKAKQQGWRSRAVFKLIEIDEKYKIFKKGQNIMDLGAAPGGWSQYVSSKLNNSGKIIATDILSMPPINAVTFVQGDFSNKNTFAKIIKIMDNSKFDVVLSDMAPNLSGIRLADQLKAERLNELAFDFAKRTLILGGSFICKSFASAGFEDFYRELKTNFSFVRTFKPQSSRSSSSESFILAFDKKI